jgi:hypothetical protein
MQPWSCSREDAIVKRDSPIFESTSVKRGRGTCVRLEVSRSTSDFSRLVPSCGLDTLVLESEPSRHSRAHEVHDQWNRSISWNGPRRHREPESPESIRPEPIEPEPIEPEPVQPEPVQRAKLVNPCGPRSVQNPFARADQFGKNLEPFEQGFGLEHPLTLRAAQAQVGRDERRLQ